MVKKGSGGCGSSREMKRCFFPLTTLQIGDLQSYRSYLSLFLACESKKLFILVDNRPWLIHLNSRATHLWQIMVTKSRLSPFANTRPRRSETKNMGKRIDPKGTEEPDINKPKKFDRWLAMFSAAALSQKKVLLPVKKLRKFMLLNTELHRTLYGFIVFEVTWTDVRGINYLNELQTDTSMAVEAKCMKRWEFESIEQASRCIPSWFSGTRNESLILEDCLHTIIGEVFYDAEEDFSQAESAGDSEVICYNDDDDDCGTDKDASSLGCNFSVYPTSAESKTSLLHTLSPPTRAYKRRKKSESSSIKSEVNALSEETPDEIFSTPKHPGTSTPIYTSDSENTVEATQYQDVFIFFRFNDHDLPFKLREIIMRDLRLLTLLEAGLPSWVIFLQSYPVFCHFYRPWMCPLVRALYVLVSVVTVLIGFYDLYKNVPVLKATASRLFGPLFDWIETWEMISRIKYLGTMLFLHNSEKALKWFLFFTRAIRSFISILTQPMAGPLVDCLDIFLPLWTTCTEGVEAFCSVVWIAIESPCSLIQNLVQILFLPLWFILSVIWSTASSIVYPIFLGLYELLYAPVRLILPLARFISSICSYTFELLGDIWLSVSNLLQLVSASEATVSTYEVSMWRTLWNDLFSQVFRAVRSIINGFVAFFAACNRHRLSIYNHIQAYLRRFSCQSNRRILDSSDSRWKYREVHSPNFSIQMLTENRHPSVTKGCATELVFRWHNPPAARRGKRYLDGKLRRAFFPLEFPSSREKSTIPTPNSREKSTIPTPNSREKSTIPKMRPSQESCYH